MFAESFSLLELSSWRCAWCGRPWSSTAGCLARQERPGTNKTKTNRRKGGEEGREMKLEEERLKREKEHKEEEERLRIRRAQEEKERKDREIKEQEQREKSA